MRKYKFYKNELGWFIDLKWFPFNKAWLAMVCGADDLLNVLAKGKEEICLEISLTGKKKMYDAKITRVHKLGLMNGALYESDIPWGDPEFKVNKNFMVMSSYIVGVSRVS